MKWGGMDGWGDGWMDGQSRETGNQTFTFPEAPSWLRPQSNRLRIFSGTHRKRHPRREKEKKREKVSMPPPNSII